MIIPDSSNFKNYSNCINLTVFIYLFKLQTPHERFCLLEGVNGTGSCGMSWGGGMWEKE